MTRVVALGGTNHFYKAVREPGRALKTDFVLATLATRSSAAASGAGS